MNEENFVVLRDAESGQEILFEEVGTVEYEGKVYAVLLTPEDDDECVIMEVQEVEEGTAYVAVEDEDDMNAIFEAFEKAHPELFEDEEE